MRERPSSEIEVTPTNLLAWTTCPRTGVLKPPRAHFDSVHQQVVMNFDHWCPWLFNSVGYLNYKHFFFLLFWVWVLTTFGALVSASLFFEILKSHGKEAPTSETIPMLLFFPLCQVLSFGVGVLFSWHCYLSLTGQTSVDHLILRGRRIRIDEDYPNPFDSGSISMNLKNAVFSEGGGFWEVFIPLYPNRLPYGKPFPGAW